MYLLINEVGVRKALFFDFWGTLWIPNLEDPTLELVAEEVAELGIVKNKTDAKLKARRWGGFPALGASKILCKMRYVCPQFIVSHSQQWILEEILTSWHLWDHFEAIESTHKHNLTKKDLLLKLCEIHQVEPILYLGDSFGDAQMAKELDLRYVHLGKKQDFNDVFGENSKKARIYPTFFESFTYILDLVGDEMGLKH